MQSRFNPTLFFTRHVGDVRQVKVEHHLSLSRISAHGDDMLPVGGAQSVSGVGGDPLIPKPN